MVSKSVPVLKGKTELETAERIAKLAVSPEMSSQRVVAASERNKGLDEHLDIPQLMSVLRAESERLSEGKSDDIGPILANQALALQSLFSRLTERALSQSQMSNRSIHAARIARTEPVQGHIGEPVITQQSTHSFR